MCGLASRVLPSQTWLSSAPRNAHSTHITLHVCTHFTHSLELELSAVIADKTTETWHSVSPESRMMKETKQARAFKPRAKASHRYALACTLMNSWVDRIAAGYKLFKFCRTVPRRWRGGGGELSVLPVVCRRRPPLVCWRVICHFGRRETEATARSKTDVKQRGCRAFLFITGQWSTLVDSPVTFLFINPAPDYNAAHRGMIYSVPTNQTRCHVAKTNLQHQTWEQAVIPFYMHQLCAAGEFVLCLWATEPARSCTALPKFHLSLHLFPCKSIACRFKCEDIVETFGAAWI